MSILKKVKHRVFGITSDELLDRLRSEGAEIGKRVIVFDPPHVIIDETRPWLLKKGEYTKITSGVVILTHDYSLSVLRRVYGEWIGEGAVTEIGKNCFIGMNSVILMGTHIGDNVIVGAGSIVKGNIPDNVVIAGNPAKVVCSLDEHYKKRKEKTIGECKDCIKRFYSVKGRMPSPKELANFKFLFTPRDKKVVEDYGLSFFCNGDEPSEVENAFYNSKPYWSSYEEMIDEIEHELKS